MAPRPNIASTAFLIADPARASMLTALLDGRAWPAGDLAQAAGITAQTASSHLGKLLAGGLLVVETTGRYRCYRLGGPHVALALETLASINPAVAPRRKACSLEAERLLFARCCYDHLAGRIGVAVTQGMQQRGFLVPRPDKQYAVTPAGAKWFGAMGLEIADLEPSQRGLARQCLDWSEREHHLAGPLGVQFMSLLCANGWLRRSNSSRAIDVTPRGWLGLREQLGIMAEAVRSEAGTHSEVPDGTVA